MQFTNKLKKVPKVIIYFAVVVAFVTGAFVLKAYAYAPRGTVPINTTDGNGCKADIINSDTFVSAVGSGYYYQTIKVTFNGDYSLVGYLTSGTCTLTKQVGGLPSENGTMAKLEWNGLFADEIYWGKSMPGYSNSTNPWSGVPSPVVPSPDPGPGISATSSPDSILFQDDAASVTFAGSRIHCYGIAGCSNGPTGAAGGEIYANGWWDPTCSTGYGSPCRPQASGVTPYRGAGWFGSPTGSPIRLTNSSLQEPEPSAVSGQKLKDLPIGVQLENTWQGNQQVVLIFSLRFPQVTDLCNNISGNQSTVPAGMVRNPDGSCSAPSTGGGCPSLPDPNVTVSLPDQSPNDPPPSGTAVGPPGGSTTYYQRVRSGRTNVTGTNDVSPGGNRYPPPLVSQAYQSAVISYQPFIDNYPYDNNQGSVTYDSYYTTHTWTGTSSWAWEYDYSYYTCTSGSNKVDSNGDGVPDSGWSCDSGYWTDVYSWHLKSNSWTDGGPGPDQTVSNTVLADAYPARSGTNPMDPCWARTYDATPVTGNAQLITDPEDPDSSTYSAQINVNYGVETAVSGSRDPMRQNSRVQLPYSISYYVDKGIGADGPVTNVNRSMMITATSANQTASGTGTASETISVYAVGSQPPNSGIPLVAGDRICWRISTTNATGSGSQTTGKSRLDGSIISGFGWRQSPSPPDWTCTQPVIDAPYFRAYGGDVIAGSAFKVSGNCTPSPSGSISAFNKGGTHYGGAGTQLAAFAIGDIVGFVSAAGRVTPPTPLSGLTFANDSGGYGGRWDSSNLSCAHDYFPDVLTNYTPVSGSMTISGATNGTFSNNPSGNLSINGGVVGPSKKVDVYVYGNVAILSNITFNLGARNDPSKIPSVRIIATGDIYVSPNVTQLDGLYVAGGSFYSCSDGGFAPPSVPQVTGAVSPSCRNSLEVYGSVVASNLYLLRSQGSLRGSSNTEYYTSGNTAERFIYSPEIWLASPNTRPQYQEPYEAYTAAPPIL